MILLCLVENQSSESLIAQRLVWEAIKQAGGIGNFKIDKEIIHTARNARFKYMDYLEETKMV
ncbi:MAG: hypothetical protein ACTS8Y_01360 [Arsenophonus sp. ER-EMS1-MAG3]